MQLFRRKMLMSFETALVDIKVYCPKKYHSVEARLVCLKILSVSNLSDSWWQDVNERVVICLKADKDLG